MDEPTSSNPISPGRTVLKALVLLVLTGFTLMGLCGGFFAVIDVQTDKPGHNEYIGVLPYFSLAIGVLGAWGCWWLYKRVRAVAK
jgi:ABC-type xylose transport system permease subunit